MRSICLKWHDFDLITVMRLMEYWIMNIDYQATETITMARDFFYLVSYIYVKIGRDVWNLYWRLNYSNSVRNKKEELLVLLYAWFSLDSIRIHSIAYYVTTTTLLLTKTEFFLAGLCWKPPSMKHWWWWWKRGKPYFFQGFWVEQLCSASK